MHVICQGLSHHAANVRLREEFAIPDSRLGETALHVRTMEGICEAVVLSTCNRVEVYAAATDSVAAFRSLDRFFHERAEGETDEVPFYRHAAPESVRHLFGVVCGLESMVLGETEILGQVKKAYQAAAESGSTSSCLNRLFQRSFNVAKEIRSQTNITRGSVSVGSVAVDLAEKIFGELTGCKVMILGAGETSELTARALRARGVRAIFVSNRSLARAEALAVEIGGKAIPFEGWDREFTGVDILISSTAAPRPLITAARLSPLMRLRQNRPLFVIDLAVPRDVEPEVNDLEGVYLYDIDSLQAITQQSLENRRREVSLCEQMIERHVRDFTGWLGRAGGPPPSPGAGETSPPGRRFHAAES